MNVNVIEYNQGIVIERLENNYNNCYRKLIFIYKI